MKYYNIRHSELCNNRFLWLWSRQMMTAKYLTFLTQPCRCPRFANNYEFDVSMWNINNSTEYRCKTDEQGNIIVPDYAHISVDKKCNERDWRTNKGLVYE